MKVNVSQSAITLAEIEAERDRLDRESSQVENRVQLIIRRVANLSTLVMLVLGCILLAGELVGYFNPILAVFLYFSLYAVTAGVVAGTYAGTLAGVLSAISVVVAFFVSSAIAIAGIASGATVFGTVVMAAAVVAVVAGGTGASLASAVIERCQIRVAQERKTLKRQLKMLEKRNRSKIDE